MRLYSLIVMLLAVFQLSAQIYNPVKWTAELQPTNDGHYLFVAKARIDQGWWVYSQYLDRDDGPIATTVNFDGGDHFSLVGKNKESDNAKKAYDKLFEMDVVKFVSTYSIEQKIKVTDISKPITGYINYMTCNDDRCLPPTDFEFSLTATAKSSGDAAPVTPDQQDVKVADATDKKADQTEHLVAEAEKKNLTDNVEVPESAITTDTGSVDIGISTEEPVVRSGIPGPKITDNGFIDHRVDGILASYTNPASDCGTTKRSADGSLFWMFVFGMLGGFVALLTPCVFPMIPLTVSFFTKDTKRKGWQNGLWYGASIIIIYVTLGLLVTAIFGAGSLNELSTNPIVNTLFFIIFIVFAFSFFGFYEITLPSSWSNKSDAMADKGGLIGIFFMAATLAIVSFSCTGPIIGTALVEAASKGITGPLLVMSGFSLALAVPFGLFAAFPAWLNSLPKSGGWMNSVKVLLGFAELALALKFLSVADMTAHWGILRYEPFMLLWALIAFGMAAYMFGLIRFPHDNPKRRLTPLPATIGVALTVMGLYLASGLLPSAKTGSYNALGMMSGLAPPAHYNFFRPLGESSIETGGEAYASLGKCANNFDCFHDYYEGLSYARTMNKPILLDFTGYGCVNCRKTEEHIWSKDVISRKIQEEFVLISLYVDDKETIEPAYKSAVTGSRIRTIGQKWADFQVVNFEQNSQPLYVIMSPDEKVLTAPRGYDPDAQGYKQFLECGLAAFQDEQQKPVIGDAGR